MCITNSDTRGHKGYLIFFISISKKIEKKIWYDKRFSKALTPAEKPVSRAAEKPVISERVEPCLSIHGIGRMYIAPCAKDTFINRQVKRFEKLYVCNFWS